MRRMRRATTFLTALALAVVGVGSAGATALAGDPPKAPPGPGAPPTPPPRPDEPTQVAGVRGEADFEAGMRRATREGRPVFLAVNAREDEGATRMLWESGYPSPAWGEASRVFVCLVANTNDHGEKTLADGTKVCARYGVGTCKAHRDAWDHAVRRFSQDGESLTSPSHFILEPDGGVVWNKSFYTGEETPAFLDAWAARLAPRLTTRRVWTAREAPLARLAKTPAGGLQQAAEAWLAQGDALAAAGLSAMLELEADDARRAALSRALAKAGPAAAPVLFDGIQAATGDPDRDPGAAFGAVDLALSVDPEFGAWAACRVLARAKDETVRGRVLVRLSGAAPGATPNPASLPAPLLARVAEARLLGGEKGAAAALAEGDRSSIGEARAARALARAGAGAPPASDLAALLADRSASRDARRAALLDAPAGGVRSNLDLVRRALADPAYEVRVAAAIALRRAGDASGATLLLAALADPIEGPDVREALAAWRGEDLGEEPGAWEEALRGGEGSGK